MSDKYILDGKTPVPCGDLMTWAKWFETGNRRVAEDMVGPLRVSTVFLGLDHRFLSDGPPLLFETMIFGENAANALDDSYQHRTSTWDEAEAAHAEAVNIARQRVSSAPLHNEDEPS